MIDVVIDLSHHNKVTDAGFNEMKRGGVKALVHKCTQGTGFEDDDYKPRMARAGIVGLMWGAYHFGDSSDPVLQADHFLRNAAGAGWLCLDWEGNGGNTMTTAQAVRFVQRIHEQTGRWPVLYSGDAFIRERAVLKNPVLKNCPLWIARYNNTRKPSASKAWTLWQYTSSGAVPGVVGNVDRNRYQGTAEELAAWWAFQSGK
jgi:lysozyme